MPGGSGKDFNGDAPPRVRKMPWSQVVHLFRNTKPERDVNMYPFSGKRIFPEATPPGIYDPSTDDLT